MKFLKRQLAMFRALNRIDLVFYLLSLVLVYIFVIFIIISDIFKLLGLASGLPKLSIEIFIFLPLLLAGMKAQNKALERIPKGLRSGADSHNIYINSHISQIWSKAFSLLRREGILSFLKKDPLELKRSVLVIVVVSLLLYIYFV